MAEFAIQEFGGRIPKWSKRLLPKNYAQEAINVKLLSGELRGLRALSLVTRLPGKGAAKRAWRVLDDDTQAEYWITSKFYEAELIKSPLIEDSYQRWYLFEPGEPPKVMTIEDLENGTGPWKLALEQPTEAPELTPDIYIEDNARDVVYVYTYVTDWGEETAPSEPATTFVDDAGFVRVSGFESVAQPEGRQWKFTRIYRSVTFGASGALFYVTDVPWGAKSYLDTRLDIVVSLNETLTTQDYQPPVDGLYGARVHPSGALVAFKGRDVYFSDPYRPHAWPTEFQIAVSDKIVGLQVAAQNVSVLTEGRPVVLYGATPSQIGVLKFSFAEPCKSYSSIIGMPDGVLYASHQGLVSVTASGPSNITRSLISEEEWRQQFMTDEIIATRYGTQYLALEGVNERPNEAFLLDTSDQRIAVTDIYWDKPTIHSMSTDFYTGDVYTLSTDLDTTPNDLLIYLWDSAFSEEVDYIWKSKQEMFQRPINMGAVIVHLEERVAEHIPAALSNPPFPEEYVTPTADVDKKKQVLVEVYANDTLVDSVWCGNREQVRLKSGHKADSWELRIIGQCRVYSIALTETGRGQGRAV